MVRGGPGSYMLRKSGSEIEAESYTLYDGDLLMQDDHDPSKLVAETPCKLLRFLLKHYTLSNLVEVSSEDDDEHEYEDNEQWMENVVLKGPRGPIKNEMIALQKEQEALDEVKRSCEKEICMKVLRKWSACVFSFKSTNVQKNLKLIMRIEVRVSRNESNHG